MASSTSCTKGTTSTWSSSLKTRPRPNERELGPAWEARADPGLARAQVAGGDLIVLNKTDLVDAATLSNVKDWIWEVRPAVQILDASYCRVPIEVLLGVEHLHAASPDGLAASSHHDHGLDFETWSYESHHPLHLGVLQQLLNHLPGTLFRAKGFVYAVDKPHHRLLLQLVGRRAVVSVNRPWGEAPPQN